MQPRKNITRGEVWLTIIFALFLSAALGVGGLYGGGYLFLLLSKVDTSILTYDTLIQSWKLWQYKKLHTPISIGTVAFILSMVLPFIGVIILGIFEFPEPDIHGNAKEITDDELEESGLLSTEQSKHPEILIGKVAKGRYKGKFLKFDGQQFMGLGAPTRSGKGVGFVIPNLLNYRDSVCVLDIKAENFIMTAGYRKKMGQEIFVFAPDGYRFSEDDYIQYKLSDHYLSMSEEEQKAFDERYFENAQVLTHRWNPLGYISRAKSRRVGDIEDIIAILFPDGGGDNAIWNSMASSVFSGYVLYMLDMEKIVKDINAEIQSNRDNGVDDNREFMPAYPVTMAQMFTLTGVPDIAAWMNDEILYWKEQGRPLSHETVEAFNRFTGVDVKTRGNIMQNFNQPLKVYQVESCMLATEANDFNFEDLRKKRMSVYIVLSPSGIKKYGRLINLFFSQLVNVNTKELPEHNPELKYQCLLVLDEFTSMGRVEIIEKSIAFTAGYDLRYMLIYQDDGQIESDEAYGKSGARVLKKNLALEVIYPPKTVDETADRVSKTFGTKTVKIKTRSRTSSLGGGVSNGENEQYVKRDLYLPQEVVELGSVKYFSEIVKKNWLGLNRKIRKRTNLGVNEIIIMEQVKPFVAHKIMYFDEPVFVKRKKIATDNIPEIPVLKEIKRFEMPRERRKDIPELSH